MPRLIAVDFETYYNTKIDYGIKQLGSVGYCRHELFDPYLISVADEGDSWAGSLNDFNWDALNGNVLLSHNEYFDGNVQKECVARGLAPAITPLEWHCTANLTSYLCNRRSLDESVEFLLGHRVDKTVRTEADGKTGAMLRANPEEWKKMLDYARGDSVECRELFRRYGHLWPQHERDLSKLTIEQGRHGVQINVARLIEYIGIAGQMLALAESVLPWIKEGRPPTSPKAIAEECRKHGIPCPPVKSRDGEDAFVQWEAAYCTRFPWIANVANWRSINKFLDTLQTIRTRLTPEGVLPFALKYFGAHTGRWSGDAGINMQNLRKDPIFRDDTGFMVSDILRLKEIEVSQRTGVMPEWVTAVLDIRSLFIPRPGKRMIISDLSQIEPRVLAWLVGDKAMLEMMASGQSPYEAHARNTMGFTGGNMKKEDKDGYALAKARVLGLGFQCAWEKFIVVAQVMAGLDITKDDPEWVPVYTDDGDPALNADGTQKMKSGYGTLSRKIVADYRAQNPKIVGMWRKLDDAFKGSLGGDFEMQLPSGRSMRYGQVRVEYRTVIDPETKKMKRKQVFTALVGNRRVAMYGGLLTENLVQATAREVFAHHMLRLERTDGIHVIFSAHDEAVNECHPDVEVKDVEGIMSECPEWLEGCPISAEAMLADHYKK